MVKAVLINGGISKTSRLTGIHEYIEAYLIKAQIQTKSIFVHELPAQDLITANFASKEIKEANQLVAEADIVIFLTPIFKASFTGILKTFLDLMPQNALENKKVVTLGLGGSLAHLLALEYSLKPVVSVLGATEILNSIYVIDQQVERLDNGEYKIADEAQERIKQELQKLKNLTTIY